MGIDGGGSKLRVVITDETMSPLTVVRGETANPAIIGHELAASRIQDAIRAALSESGIKQITAVGIGIAGASAEHAEAWLVDTVRFCLPDSAIFPSSDNEIALVGARGERRGVLLLAGTGSVAFGINASGQKLQVGGWGYLLGDEGSGYWIGLRALKMLISRFDGRHEYECELVDRILDELQLTKPRDLIAWLYGQQPPPVARVADLALIVLEQAGGDDMCADEIIVHAAHALETLAQTVVRRLSIADPNIVFAGGLLTGQNALSRRVAALLGLEALPVLKYPPVIGAALLAKLCMEEAGIQC